MIRVLNESKRDDMLLPYVNLLRERGINTNVSQLKQFLLKKFVNEGLMRNLSLGSNFYLAGVARYYFNGDLTTNKILNVFDESQTDEFKQDICERLNACILVLRNAHIDSVGQSFEQPEDFGELKLIALLRKYGAKINQVLGIVPDKKKKEGKKEVILDENPSVGNGYTFDILYSYEDARKYKKFTEPGAWCITYGEQHYNGYVRNLGIHYVIFRQDGYENVPRKMGENFTKRKPHDEYGNSLIALLQSNKTGEPKYITSRWNHGAQQDGTQGTEADHAYNKEEFCRITGVTDADLQRIFTIWKEKREVKKKENSANSSLARKKNLEALRYLKYGQMRMNGGEDVRNVFKGVSAMFLHGKQDGTIKKCICVLQVPIWGEDNTNPESVATILCDNGKMLFDTFKLHEDRNYSWMMERMFQSSSNPNNWDASRYSDIILIRHDNYKQLYSTKYHKLIDILGVTKFKYLGEPSSWNRKKTCFYEVALSGNQRAFIDFQTNKPLRLPNGDFWVESWRTIKIQSGSYSREVNCKAITLDDSYIEMVYDSAADSKFYFDLASKRFFTPEAKEDWKLESYGSRIIVDGIYALHYSDNAKQSSIYSLYKEGKPFKMLGESDFRYIAPVFNVLSEPILLNIRKLNGEEIIYDYTKQKEIELYDYSGTKIKDASLSSAGEYGHDMGICWVKLPAYRYDHVALYDLNEKRFLLNPCSKSYIFYIWSSTISSKTDVTITGFPYIFQDKINPQYLPQYSRGRTRIDLSIDLIKEFTNSYSSKIGGILPNEDVDKEEFLRKLNNNEIDFFKAVEENKNFIETNFIIENVIKQLGVTNISEQQFIIENIKKQLLNEITVTDAYTSYYKQYMPEEDYNFIVTTIQGNNTILAPDTGVKWVLDLYKRNGKQVLRELYKLHNYERTGALDIYLRAKQRRMLPVDKTDLGKFKSINELVVFVREELDANEIMGRTKKEMSKAVRAAKNETQFLYEDDVWMVVIPKSYESSCYWGQDADWCTSTREHDYHYNEYASYGPLYININKHNGEKFQFHFEKDEFKDMNNYSIDTPILENIGASQGLIEFYNRYFSDDVGKLLMLKYELFDDAYYSYNIYKSNMNFYIFSKKYDRVINNEPALDYSVDDSRSVRMELVDGWVFYDSYYDILHDEIKFDSMDEFEYDIAMVQKGNKYNFINIDGGLLSDTWFDEITKYGDTFYSFLVKVNDKINLFDIKTKELALDEWVDDIEFDEDIDFLGVVTNNGKKNLLNDREEYVLPMFVDDIEPEEFLIGNEYWIAIQNDNKWNFFSVYSKEFGSSIWFDNYSLYRDAYHQTSIIAEVDGRKVYVYLDKGIMEDPETWEKTKIADIY